MSTWNPSDKSANVTLSGGNLTASHPSTTVTGSVRSTDSHATGKWYFEVAVTGVGSSSDGPAVGISTAGADLSFFPGEAFGVGLLVGTGALKIRKWNGGFDAALDTSNTPSDGDVVMVALDLTNSKLWFGRNGTWYGTTDGGAAGNPAAGTNPAYTSVSGTFFAAWGGTNGLASTGIARFTTSAFSYSAPSGFTAWDGSSFATGAGAAAGTSTATAVGNVNGVAVGSSAGTSTAAAVAAPGPAYGTSAGTSTAAAASITAVKGVGSSAGQCLVAGASTLPLSTNYMPAVGVLVREQSYTDDDNGATPSTGTSVTVLNDGVRNGTAHTMAALSQVYAYLPAAPLVDKLVIYSSNLDPSDQLAYPTFSEPSNLGLIGGATSGALLVILNHKTEISNTAHYNHTYFLVNANRATRLELNISPPVAVNAIYILGATAPNFSTGAVGTIEGLRTGTLLKEIELLHTYTLIEGIEHTAIALTSAARVAVVGSGASALNFTSTTRDVREVDLTSSLNLASVATSVSSIHGRAVDNIDFSSQTSGELGGAVTSALNFTSATTFNREADLTSALNLASVATPIGKPYASAVASLNLTSAVAFQAASALTSALNFASVAPGVRVFTLATTSSLALSSLAPASNDSDLAVTSGLNFTSAITGAGSVHESLTSTVDFTSFVRLPSGALMQLFTNPQTMAAATWSGLPFNSMIEVDGVVYGAGVNGLYVLDDAEDDIGEDIDAEVTWDLMNFGDMNKKRYEGGYVSGVSAGPLSFSVVNEQGSFDYPTDRYHATNAGNQRATFGRGLFSAYARVSLTNPNGVTFDVSDVRVQVYKPTRRS